MVANIEGLAGFTKRNRRSCEIFTQGVRKLWGHGDFVSKPMTLPEIDHVIFVALMRRHFSPVNVGGSHGQLVCPYMGLIRAIVVRMRKVLAIPQSRSQSPRFTLVQRNGPFRWTRVTRTLGTRLAIPRSCYVCFRA